MKDKVYFLAGTLFFFLGLYKIFIYDYWEATMYMALGIGFSITGILKNDLFLSSKRLLEVVSWVMIFIAIFIFLFLLRTDNV